MTPPRLIYGPADEDLPFAEELPDPSTVVGPVRVRLVPLLTGRFRYLNERGRLKRLLKFAVRDAGFVCSEVTDDLWFPIMRGHGEGI